MVTWPALSHYTHPGLGVPHNDRSPATVPPTGLVRASSKPPSGGSVPQFGVGSLSTQSTMSAWPDPLIARDVLTNQRSSFPLGAGNYGVNVA